MVASLQGSQETAENSVEGAMGVASRSHTRINGVLASQTNYRTSVGLHFPAE